MFRGIRYGNAAVDDYTVFEQDTVHRDETRMFRFVESPDSIRFLDTLALDFYLAKQDRFHYMTLAKAIDTIGKPAAAIVVRNDTILYEHYGGGSKNH